MLTIVHDTYILLIVDPRLTSAAPRLHDLLTEALELGVEFGGRECVCRVAQRTRAVTDRLVCKHAPTHIGATPHHYYQLAS